MSLLYEIFILPIEIIYRAIYLGSLQFTHNYGLSILVLSCISAVAFIPLGRLAVGTQAREKKLQMIMAASTTSTSAMPTIRCWPSGRPSAWPCRSPS